MRRWDFLDRKPGRANLSGRQDRIIGHRTMHACMEQLVIPEPGSGSGSSAANVCLVSNNRNREPSFSSRAGRMGNLALSPYDD